MNHKKKIKLARKLLTRKEILDRTPIFSSKAWINRKEAIEKRINSKPNLTR